MGRMGGQRNQLRPNPRVTCYAEHMRREDLVAFARRDWDAVAVSKRRRWAQQKARMTAAEALRLGDELRRHVRALQDGWPSREDRAADLAVHVRVSESLRRVDPRRL
jgi:hypothetical protein